LGSDDSKGACCDAIGSIAAGLPNHPEALYELALCIHSDIGSKISLLLPALAID